MQDEWYHVMIFYLVSMEGIPQSRSFLEREDFESELGAVDPFSEDFSDISHYDIVEVIADGDRVARYVFLKTIIMVF